METVYLAGGCLWGVQAFVKTLPGVVQTEGGRANGITDTLDGEYDGYVEVIKTGFDPEKVSVSEEERKCLLILLVARSRYWFKI